MFKRIFHYSCRWIIPLELEINLCPSFLIIPISPENLSGRRYFRNWEQEIARGNLRGLARATTLKPSLGFRFVVALAKTEKTKQAYIVRFPTPSRIRVSFPYVNFHQHLWLSLECAPSFSSGLFILPLHKNEKAWGGGRSRRNGDDVHHRKKLLPPDASLRHCN